MKAIEPVFLAMIESRQSIKWFYEQSIDSLNIIETYIENLNVADGQSNKLLNIW